MSLQRLLEQYVFACFGAPGAGGRAGEEEEAEEVYEAAAAAQERRHGRRRAEADEEAEAEADVEAEAEAGDARGRRQRQSEHSREVRALCVRVVERCNEAKAESGEEVAEGLGRLLAAAMESLGGDAGRRYVLARVMAGERKKMEESLGRGPKRNAADLTLFQILVEQGLSLEERRDVFATLSDLPESALGDEHSMNSTRVFVDIHKDARRAIAARSRKFFEKSDEKEAAQLVAAAVGEKAFAVDSSVLPIGSAARATAIAGLCRALEHSMTRISIVTESVLLGANLAQQRDVRAEQLKVLFPRHLMEAES